MITLDNITIQFGSRVILQNAGFTIYPKHKVGLVGKNGSGKSTLLALIRGEIQPDNGACDIAKNLTIAHVAQETPNFDQPALEFVLDGDQRLRQTEQKLRLAEQENDAQAMADCHEQLNIIDGYAAPSRAGQILHGLGFHAHQFQWSVKDFSGGWRMRLNLAQALMCPSDVLLLDEPTNHLDLDAVIWLEQWLKDYPGALILISHDVDFLDKTVKQILHIERQQIKMYTGNYSTFERVRAEQLALQQAAHEKQQIQRAHMQKFVDRFRAKASKAKQAQSRMKALEKMQLIEAAQEDGAFHFDFLEPKACPNPLVSLHKARIGYSEKEVFHQLTLSLNPGSRYALLGANGAGKSTFLKAIAGSLPLLAGELHQGSGLKIGYFTQHQIDYLDLSSTPLQHMKKLAGNEAGEQQLRNYLGSFLFAGEMALAPVQNFSGGEKARLSLAMLIWQRPNLLLLDEPTNHLDMDMRHALAMALQQFSGALMVVSHDRQLLKATTDELWLVTDGDIKPFDGDFDDYEKWLLETRRQMIKQEIAAQKNKQPALSHQQLRELKKKAASLEKQIETTQQKLQQVEVALADGNLYQENADDKLQALVQQRDELKAHFDMLEEQWLEISEQL